MALKRTLQRLEFGPAILSLAALASLSVGLLRLLRHGHVSLVQLGYCAVATLAAGFVLMIADYTFHHARVVFLLVVAAVVLFAFQSPAFCVGLGVALGAILFSQSRG